MKERRLVADNKMVTLKMKKEEVSGNYKFDGKVVMTSNFAHTYGGQIPASMFAMQMLEMIHEEVKEKNGCDYLRVFLVVDDEGDTEKIFVIDDVEHLTIMMAEDY